MNFASDNTAGVAPDILSALAAGNDGFVLGYGDDDVTRAVERRFEEVFEHECAVFLVPTGTAANALALAHVSPPWGAVFAHAEAHVLTDECGAPEFFGSGLKLVGLPGEGCKVAPGTLASVVAQYQGHAPHQVVPAAFSFAQASEAGTIYRPAEIAALAKIAHENGMKVHMDGARFANALVRLNASPAAVTWQAGVDVLSFGATKGGALAAEAVVFFDRAAAHHMAERRKRAGHLLSKHRFLALQLQAFLANDCWLRLARHANAMADRLAAGLAAAGHRPVWPVEANLVFVALPKALNERLRTAGARYYVRRSESLPAATASSDRVLVRLVTSFATRGEEIDRFLDVAAKT
jgi:threonine aldolase